MTKYYVKKLTSLNPTKYRYIEVFEAHRMYYEYIENWIKIVTDPKYYGTVEQGGKPKTFEQWLKTEI